MLLRLVVALIVSASGLSPSPGASTVVANLYAPFVISTPMTPAGFVPTSLRLDLTMNWEEELAYENRHTTSPGWVTWDPMEIVVEIATDPTFTAPLLVQHLFAVPQTRTAPPFDGIDDFAGLSGLRTTVPVQSSITVTQPVSPALGMLLALPWTAWFRVRLDGAIHGMGPLTVARDTHVSTLGLNVTYQ